MTGSFSDRIEWQQHIRNKHRQEELYDRFQDPNNPFKIAIVSDM
jgi:type I restriction enzyme R subunit